MAPFTYKYTYLFVVCILLIFPSSVSAVAGIKTDFALYPIPSVPPVFSGAGSVVTDPTFGTSIMKVTDQNDGISCGVNYSYYGSFNKDSTWLMAVCSENVSTWSEPVAIFYKWDTTNFKILQKVVKRFSDTPYALDLGQGIWSGTDPHVLYVLKSYGYLYAYNIITNQATLVKNFATLFPGEYQWQFHRSNNDDVFSFTRKSQSNYSTVGYAVWKRSTDEIIYSENISDMDEVQIDKTGGFLVVKLGDFVNPEAKIVNVTTGSVVLMNDGAPDFNLGHSDNGVGIQVGEENWNGRIWKYNLSNPSLKTDLLGQSMWPWNTGGGHYSLLADDESWVLASTNDGSSILGRELYLLATDGSLRIKRIAHHRSTSGLYSNSPRPNISRDGKFVAFTSNWENVGSRTDLYVVSTYERIPPDVTPPILSAVSSSVTTSSARISWVTDELSDTQVEYGLTTSYGNTTALNTTPVTVHNAELGSLAPNTVYHYRVKSKDASGNISVSTNNTFTTASPITPVDTIAPSTPTNLTVSAVGTSQITLSWTASTDNVGVAGYAVYRNNIYTGTSGTTTYTDTGLSADTSYTYTVSAYDSIQNTSQQTISVSTRTLSALLPVETSTTTPNIITPVVQTVALVTTVPTTLPTSTPQTLTLTQTLSKGKSHPEVTLLQGYLKNIGLFDPSIQVTAYFGAYTESAVKKYQTANGIDPTGIVGPLTRARLAGSSVPLQTTTTPKQIASFPVTLSIGMQHPDVVMLQNILKKSGFLSRSVPSSGYFGSATKKAVQYFQRTYGVVSGGSESTTGYGMVGKKTWVKLLSL